MSHMKIFSWYVMVKTYFNVRFSFMFHLIINNQPKEDTVFISKMFSAIFKPPFFNETLTALYQLSCKNTYMWLILIF